MGKYSDLQNFLQVWSAAEKKKAILDELSAEGVFLSQLRDAYRLDADIDDFDLILQVAYGKPLKTRRQRAQTAKRSDELKKYPEQCRAVLNALLDKYSTNGISELESMQVLRNAPFDAIDSPTGIVNLFGGKEKYLQAVRLLTDLIYQAA